MNFETNKDVLEWYERQERTLTPEFISAIPWDKVKDAARYAYDKARSKLNS